MKQRVCIALGIILTPELIIADEPTSALDVVTQRQVMQTLKDIPIEDRFRPDPDRARHGADGAVSGRTGSAEGR